MLAALRRGNNGAEILAILDAVTAGDNAPAETATATAQPTLDPIDFWSLIFNYSP